MRRAFVASLGWMMGTLAVQAQTPADALLSAGHVTAAESAYFAATTARPHDPTARFALAGYLAQRGRLRVAAVLFEEARTFGGDTAAIDRALVPLYTRLGDYRNLAVLPSAIVGDGIRLRAQWLLAHPTTLRFLDSTVVEYRPSSDSTMLGRLPATVGGESLEALIRPAAVGLVIDAHARAASHVRRFSSTASGPVAGVLDTLEIGSLRLINLPVTIDALSPGSPVVMGFDVLAPFSPTYDLGANRVTLRLGPPAALASPERVPVLVGAAGMRVSSEQGLESVMAPGARARLRAHAWTYDQKSGVILIAP